MDAADKAGSEASQSLARGSVSSYPGHSPPQTEPFCHLGHEGHKGLLNAPHHPGFAEMENDSVVVSHC